MMSLDSLKLQILQRAWDDPAFKQELLTNPKKAIRDAVGVDIPAHIEVKALEEKPGLFYLVVPQPPEESADGRSDVGAAW